jgi:putative ABC transport system substrate-binding protein
MPAAGSDQSPDGGAGKWLPWLAAALILPVLVMAWLGFRSVTGGPGGEGRPRVGIVTLTRVDDATATGFREGLAELGYRDGSDIRLIHEGPAGDLRRAEERLRALLAQRVDLLFVSSTPVAVLARKLSAGSGIPVIFAPVNDPLGAGLVNSLRAPGGNMTGIRLAQDDQLRLQWLRELLPGARRLLIPYTRSDRSALATLSRVREVADALGFHLVELPLADDQDLGPALAARKEGVDAIFLPRDSRVESQLDAVLAHAREQRLPTCVPSPTQVERGALFSYGFIHRQIGRQAARLAQQVLRGTAPGDLPVETAESYVAFNLDQARQLGLVLPDHLLHQAALLVGKQEAP